MEKSHQFPTNQSLVKKFVGNKSTSVNMNYTTTEHNLILLDTPDKKTALSEINQVRLIIPSLTIHY